MKSSRNRTSITGKKVIQHKPAIKPVKARRIIRKYHFWLNKKSIILSKLGEGDYAKNKEYLKGSGITSEPQELLKLETVDDRSTLLQLLGFIDTQINEKGGLQNYQLASTIGQNANRGGDSSKILVEWVRELFPDTKYTALEIGCLSTKNYINKLCTKLVGIDLNSNEPAILKQDFMERPLPKTQGEMFSMISCSLVLNFVPTPEARGEMIKRFTEFLLPNGLLFVVLPLPCINNSRYMDKNLYERVMKSQGFTQIKYREAKKVVYMLYVLDSEKTKTKFARKKLHDKKGMNNFSVVLQ